MSAEKRETLTYWEERAKNVDDVGAVTHADTFQRQLEIDTIVKYLNEKDRVLDIGCGNGYGTAIFAEHCAQISGIDFSPKMIDRARVENSRNGTIGYEVADIRTHKLDKRYSKILTVRCLINILDWDDQKKAIRNVAGAIEPGGHFLMMEGFADGRSRLNEARTKLGLGELRPVPYNLDFERQRTEEFLREFFEIEDALTFGSYELVTRVIYPMYVQPEEPTYGSKFHQIALKLCESVPDIIPGISKFGLWVLKRR